MDNKLRGVYGASCRGEIPVSEHYGAWNVRQTVTVVMHLDNKPARVKVYHANGDLQADFYIDHKITHVVMRLLKAAFDTVTT